MCGLYVGGRKNQTSIEIEIFGYQINKPKSAWEYKKWFSNSEQDIKES